MGQQIEVEVKTIRSGGGIVPMFYCEKQSFNWNLISEGFVLLCIDPNL